MGRDVTRNFMQNLKRTLVLMIVVSLMCLLHLNIDDIEFVGKKNIAASPIFNFSLQALRSKVVVITDVIEPQIEYLPNNSMVSDKTIKFTYSDPKDYEGPIVEGWPPQKNRSIEIYMTGSFGVLPEHNMLTNKDLIVIVQSRLPSFTIRQSCRETWGTLANNQTSVLFLFGNEARELSEEANNLLIKEQETYGDIIQVKGFVEHYTNLTLKTLYTLKFFLNKDIFNSSLPKYIMKVDDDTFVNLPLLWDQLQYASRIKNLLMGHRFDSSKRIQAKRLKHNYRQQFVTKWQVPDYMYNGEKYPQVLSGSGYVLSRSSVECIYAESLKIPYFHLEDVHITGFAAEYCGIERLHNPGFKPNADAVKRKRTFNKEIILVHYINSFWRREFIKQFK